MNPGLPAARRTVRLALWPLATAFGVLTLAVARAHPDGSFGGGSVLAGIAELAAGWGLIGLGLVFWGRHRGNIVGPLLVAGGFAWFLPEWSNQDIGVSLAFAVGIAAFVACAPLVAHAALAYPTGRLTWVAAARSRAPTPAQSC